MLVVGTGFLWELATVPRAERLASETIGLFRVASHFDAGGLLVMWDRWIDRDEGYLVTTGGVRRVYPPGDRFDRMLARRTDEGAWP